MAPRDPQRPKAAHIPDEGFLRSVAHHRENTRRYPDPRRAWLRKGYPEKVVSEKVRKLIARGLISGDLPSSRPYASAWPPTRQPTHLYLTTAGREFLELQEKAS